MKLAFASDWHLDFLSEIERKKFYNVLNGLNVNGFIFSGDLGSDNFHDILISLTYSVDKPFYFVHGNHDFYGKSFHETREETRNICSLVRNLNWLELKSISLKPKVAICGCDGWYDGNYGNYGVHFQLRDFDLIGDFKYKNCDERKKVMNLFSDIGAKYIKRELPQLLDSNDLVILVTHAPPFKESCYFWGKPTDDNALPFFSNKNLGDVIKSIMKDYPNKELLVLCGHTHFESDFELDNIQCKCAEIKYSKPSICTVIEI